MMILGGGITAFFSVEGNLVIDEGKKTNLSDHPDGYAIGPSLTSSEFTDNDWEKFNSYMVHRFISMHVYYVEIADYAQSMLPTMKKPIYNFYKEMLPKKKMFLRYIKSKIKTSPKEVKQYISNYYKCSLDEANEYIRLLDKSDIKIIFDTCHSIWVIIHVINYIFNFFSTF